MRLIHPGVTGTNCFYTVVIAGSPAPLPAAINTAFSSGTLLPNRVTAGDYDVYFKAESTVGGCFNVTSKPIKIVPNVQAAFSYDPNPVVDNCGSATITLQNGSTNVTNGSTYTWQRADATNFPSSNTITIGTGLTTGDVIPDQTTTLNHTTTNSTQTYYVRLRVQTPEGCTVNSAGQSVVVRRLPGAPSLAITSVNGVAPGSQTYSFCVGDVVVLTATGLSGTSYQWTLPASLTGASTSNTITVTAVSDASGAVSVTQTLNGCTSAALNRPVTVNPLPTTPTISISAGDTDATFCANGVNSVTLQSTAAPSVGGYRWYRDGTLQSSLTSQSIVLSTAAASGSYTVRTTNAAGCRSSESSAQAVSIQAIPTAPVISVQSGALDFCEGSSLVLQAPATAGISYRWFKDGVNSGLAGNTITLTNQSLHAGVWTAIAVGSGSEQCESSSSNGLTVRIGLTPSAPILTSTPNPATACIASVGSAITLQASGSASTYEWSKGVNVITGASGSTLALNADGDDGNYTVKAINNISGSSVTCPSPASNSVPVIVYPIPAAQTITTSGSTVVCQGASNIVLNTTNAGTGFRYQWKKNGIEESTTSSPSLQIPASSPFTATNYTVTVVAPAPANCPGSESSPVSVTVNPLPAQPSLSASADVCSGNAVTLSTTATAASYTWSRLTTPTSSTTTASSSFTVNTVGTTQQYQLRVKDSNNCESPVSSTVTFNIYPLPNDLSVTSDATGICDGTATNINIANTQSGFTYRLKNGAMVVATGTGNGGTLSLSTGNLAASGSPYTFSVETESNTSPACTRVMTNTAMVNVGPIPLSALQLIQYAMVHRLLCA